MAYLYDNLKKQRLPLTRRTSIAGRELSNDLVFKGRYVSRTHFQIIKKLTGCVIEDLESAHGTYVNNVRITSATALKDGDVIRIAITREREQEAMKGDASGDATQFRGTKGRGTSEPKLDEDDDLQIAVDLTFRSEGTTSIFRRVFRK